jgi:hypothetical protein
MTTKNALTFENSMTKNQAQCFIILFFVIKIYPQLRQKKMAENVNVKGASKSYLLIRSLDIRPNVRMYVGNMLCHFIDVGLFVLYVFR